MAGYPLGFVPGGFGGKRRRVTDLRNLKFDDMKVLIFKMQLYSERHNLGSIYLKLFTDESGLIANAKDESIFEFNDLSELFKKLET